MSNNRRVLTIAVPLVLVLAAGAVLLLWVWRRTTPVPPPAQEGKTPEPATSEAPTLPEDMARKDELLTSKALVSGDVAGKDRRGYIHDVRMPAGVLRGVCYVPFEKNVRVYPPMPVELDADGAIKAPAKGEREYIEARQPQSPVWLGPFYAAKKRYGVQGAVVMIRKVEAGPRPTFDQITYRVDYREQQILAVLPQGDNVYNPSWNTVGVSPPVDMIQVMNLSLYDCQMVIARAGTGEAKWDALVPGYRDPKFPGEYFGTNFQMAQPVFKATPPFREAGVYAITCKRHAWHRAWLVIADSPYVAVTPETYNRDAESTGAFAIGGVPLGTHEVEVWHPEYEPEKRTMTVEIRRDEATEIPIAFKVPAALTTPPPQQPKTFIYEWVMVGPLDPLLDKDARSPEKAFDFKARYEDIEGKTVGWKRIEVGKEYTREWGEAGLVTPIRRYGQKREGAAYFASWLDSPKEQRALFRLRLDGDSRSETLKVWLNGQAIHYTYPAEFRGNEWRNNAVIAGRLKAGRNTLLVRLTRSGLDPYGCGFAMTYLAEGVTVKAPDAAASSNQ